MRKRQRDGTGAGTERETEREIHSAFNPGTGNLPPICQGRFSQELEKPRVWEEALAHVNWGLGSPWLVSKAEEGGDGRGSK